MTRARERLILQRGHPLRGLAGGAVHRRRTGRLDCARVRARAGRGESPRGGGGRVGVARVRLTLAMPGGQDSTPPAPPAAPSPPAMPLVPQASPPGSSPAVPAPPVTTLSYTSLAAYARCGYRFYCERVLRPPEASEPTSDGPKSDFRSGAERGVLLHALLQRLNFRRPVVPGPEVVAAVAADAGLAPPTPDEAREAVRPGGAVCLQRAVRSPRVCDPDAARAAICLRARRPGAGHRSGRRARPRARSPDGDRR